MRFQKEVSAEELASALIPDKVIRGATDHPSQVPLSKDKSLLSLSWLPPAASVPCVTKMNRAYIEWLESLPCNQHRQRRKVNEWMSDWAPLPTEIDLPTYEEWQLREIQRNPKGLMNRVRQWLVS